MGRTFAHTHLCVRGFPSTLLEASFECTAAAADSYRNVSSSRHTHNTKAAHAGVATAAAAAGSQSWSQAYNTSTQDMHSINGCAQSRQAVVRPILERVGSRGSRHATVARVFSCSICSEACSDTGMPVTLCWSADQLARLRSLRV